MELNRATTLAKSLLRDRALKARERKDEALRKNRLFDNDAYPGSNKFPQAVQVIVQYMEDLADAEISSVSDAYEQTGIPVSAQAVERAITSLRNCYDTLIATRVACWQGTLDLVKARTRATPIGSDAALAEGHRELKRQASRLMDKADARLDVVLHSSLARSEQRDRIVDKRSEVPSGTQSSSVPSWFPKAGLVSAGIAFLFVVSLVGMAIGGRDVPSSARLLVDIAIALAMACAFTFIGGTAQAEGKIPFFKGHEPIKFATTGGIAVFVVVFGLLVLFYR